MKKILALFLLSIVLVASVTPAFAGWNKPQPPVEEKCTLVRHDQGTDYDYKTGKKIIKCQCDYQNWYGITNRYVGPQSGCPYCSHPEYFY